MPVYHTHMFARAAILVTMSAGIACAAPPELAPDAKGAGGREAEPNAVQTLAAVLPKLDSTSIYDRLEAQDELRRVVGTRLATVEALLEQPKLSAEQSERLSNVGYSIFAAQPRAAMGVRFALTEGNGEGVSIEGVVNGFDAAAVLVPGDVIRTIAGVPIRQNMDARRVIISFEPGEDVPVEIVRQGQLRDVRVKLGAYSDLNNGFRVPVDSASLRLAWETRVARIRHSVMQEPLATGLTRDRTDALRLQAFMPRILRQRGGVEVNEVVSTVGDGPLIVAAGRLRSLDGGSNRLFNGRVVKGDIWSDLQAKTEQANQLLKQERAICAALRDATLPADQRARQEFNLTQIRSLIIRGSNERRDAWKTLRLEQEALEEPH